MDASAPNAWNARITTTSVVNFAASGTQLGTGIASLTSLILAARSLNTSSPE